LPHKLFGSSAFKGLKANRFKVYQWPTNSKTKGLHFCKPMFCWWALADLNRGPKDYEHEQQN
jgi:hypothetical protein